MFGTTPFCTIFVAALSMSPNGLHVDGLDVLRRFDSCTIANAIERFNVRPRNEGFMSGGPVCRFPDRQAVVGHAVTGRIRTYMPPVAGKCYYEHTEWWRYLDSRPRPRIVVLEDFDNQPGVGALFGEIHARICRALGCVGYVTNGAVRDLGGIEPLGFQLFSGSVAVSHAYAHVVDFGDTVEVGGLQVQPGDILHGDRNGIVSVPADLVARLPQMAEQLGREEQELIDLTESPDFSTEALIAKLHGFAEKQK